MIIVPKIEVQNELLSLKQHKRNFLIATFTIKLVESQLFSYLL